MSEKQAEFIKNLYNDIKKYATEIDEQDAKIVMEALKPHADTIAQAIQDGDIENFKAKRVIDIMIGLKKLVTPVDHNIKWRKIGPKWAVCGHKSVMTAGATVTVHSSRGTQDVELADMASIDGDMVCFYPVEKEIQDVSPGFYRNSDDEIIEVYNTRKGIAVARKVVEGGGKEYLGKRGMTDLGEKLSLEEAKQYGRETGHCIVCGKELTDPESVSLGIGPVCLAKWGV